MQWIWFILGQIVNVLRQAKLVADSRPDKNSINSPWRWIYRNSIGLAVREVFAVSLWLLLVHPSAGPALIAHWKPEYAQYAPLFHQIPFLAAPFGIVFSIGSDYLLEKWPWLKAHIPSLGE